MANRQDSGSNSAHQNERPTSHNEDAVPEMMDDESVRGRADEEDEEDFEDADTEEVDEAEEDEGSF